MCNPTPLTSTMYRCERQLNVRWHVARVNIPKYTLTHAIHNPKYTTSYSVSKRNKTIIAPNILTTRIQKTTNQT